MKKDKCECPMCETDKKIDKVIKKPTYDSELEEKIKILATDPERVADIKELFNKGLISKKTMDSVNKIVKEKKDGNS